jgi:hypothetical protein
LGVRKIDEEEATAKDNDPRLDAGACNSKKNDGRKEEQKVVVPSIKNHGIESVAFSSV